MAHPELWYFLAPAEEGEEMNFNKMEEAGLLRRRPSLEQAKPPARPGSALTDKTGRRMVYGNPKFRFAQIEEQEQARAQQKNDYEGSLRGGLPHGFGTKIYAVEKRWQGRLWPFGTIFQTSVVAGQLIRYSEYLKSMGILRNLANPIIVVDGKHTVATMLDISRILERLKPVNGQVVALIVNFTKETVFQEIGFHAKHSAYLESFNGPVIGVLKGEFECEPLSWPAPEEIVDRIPDLHSHYKHPWLANNRWHMESSSLTPPTISLSPMGEQHLDKHGNFPIEPVGQFEVRIKWEGKEAYVGDFKEGAKHGKGIFIRSNGDKHVGHYQGGNAHGKGVYHWKNGDTWVGSWLHGRQDSRGEMRTFHMQLAALLLQGNIRMSQARQELEALGKKDKKLKSDE